MRTPQQSDKDGWPPSRSPALAPVGAALPEQAALKTSPRYHAVPVRLDPTSSVAGFLVQPLGFSSCDSGLGMQANLGGKSFTLTLTPQPTLNPKLP